MFMKPGPPLTGTWPRRTPSAKPSKCAFGEKPRLLVRMPGLALGIDPNPEHKNKVARRTVSNAFSSYPAELPSHAPRDAFECHRTLPMRCVPIEPSRKKSTRFEPRFKARLRVHCSAFAARVARLASTHGSSSLVTASSTTGSPQVSARKVSADRSPQHAAWIRITLNKHTPSPPPSLAHTSAVPASIAPSSNPPHDYQ